MEGDDRWIFSKERLANSPSRKFAYDADKELLYRQQAANAIQNVGRRLELTELCMNTAIVYMHRFYVFHSFTRFHKSSIVAASLFLAAKVENDRPCKFELVVKTVHSCLHPELPSLNTEQCSKQIQDLELNENILLGTLGFDIAIDHPHPHILRCCHINNASKELAKKAYFMASNTLHLTTMCIQYKPTVVACFCIHLACKLFNMEVPLKNDTEKWFWYLDKSVTEELLNELVDDYLNIVDKCPSWLKRKICANQNIRGYHRGVYELNQKRVPGGDSRGETSSGILQQPTDGRIPDEDSRRKRQDGKVLPPNYHQHLPAPTPRRSSSHVPPLAGMRCGGLSTSQPSGSHPPGAGYQNPTSGSGCSGISATASWPAALGLPPPPTPPSTPRHADRPETTFLPSKQHNYATDTPVPPNVNPSYDHEFRLVDKYRESKHSKYQSSDHSTRQAGSSVRVSHTSTRSSSSDEYQMRTKFKRHCSADNMNTVHFRGDFPSHSLALPLPPPPPPPPIYQTNSISYPGRTTPPPDSPPRGVKPILPIYLQVSQKHKGRERSREKEKHPLDLPLTPPLPPPLVISNQTKPHTNFYPGNTTPPPLPQSPTRELMLDLPIGSLKISKKDEDHERNSGKKINKHKEKHRSNPKEERTRHRGYSVPISISKERIDLSAIHHSSDSPNRKVSSHDKDSTKTSSKKRDRSEEDKHSHPSKHGKTSNSKTLE